jgi:hypothetical protein
LEQAFAAMSTASVRALVILTDPIFFGQRKRIVDLATRSRLPAMYFFENQAEARALLAVKEASVRRPLAPKSAAISQVAHGTKHA